MFSGLNMLHIFCFLEVRVLFRLWREENVRKSVEVVDLWERILQKKIHKFGDESKWHFVVILTCSLHRFNTFRGGWGLNFLFYANIFQLGAGHLLH
jgi:hypothetical protein